MEWGASLRRSSQWGFRVGAVVDSGPNTKQSHKPSVDLATNDCDTSRRSSRVRASLNPASLPQAAACRPRERRAPSSTSQSTGRKRAGEEEEEEEEEEEGWWAQALLL